MTAPVINPSTLTEEQRDMLRIFYLDAKSNLDSENELPQTVGYARITLIYALFGEEFFNEKGE